MESLLGRSFPDSGLALVIETTIECESAKIASAALLFTAWERRVGQKIEVDSTGRRQRPSFLNKETHQIFKTWATIL